MRARLLGMGLAALIVAAAPRTALTADLDDPEWPCVQRKVPELSIGQMWPGPMPAGEWRDDPTIARLAPALAVRRTTLDEVERRAADYAATLDAAARPERLAELFAGVLHTIQGERGQVLAGIGRYARNQAAQAGRIEDMQAELAALRAAPEAERDPGRIEELQDALTWEERIYKERAQSLTYVCETPVLLEQRAFAIARLIATQI